MKPAKIFNKALVALGAKQPPRRRGLGKKTLARMAAERAIVPYSPGEPATVAKPRVLPNGALLTSVRAYKEVAGVGGVNSDWAVNALSEDSDIWQNIFLLRQRSRDLFRTDVYFKKYREELWANVFGADGITLRMAIKETEDRVVFAPDEKSFLKARQRQRHRVYKFIERKFGRKLARDFIDYDRQSATVQVGDLDIYANNLIEDAWREWQRPEFCTVTGQLDYNEVRQIRLLSAARDGDFFIRHIEDPSINKFGYSLQLINSEWCDFYLNTTLKNGNEIRMGIERDRRGKPLNYYFIKRMPMDWQFSIPGAFNYSSAMNHEIVPAYEIIHYARREDGDSTRPAPWSAAVIPKSRHLDKYEEAEVVAARVAAMKLGFFYSDIIPEGGTTIGEQPDPTKASTLEAEPGSFQGLEYGVKFQGWDPNHPNGNFDLFRKGMLRAWCAGLPGANYNIIANDLEGVNYSSGRLGMLDERELWKLLQKFDIKAGERPTFERWLQTALTVGAVPLPLAKFAKFNRPIFRGRRWAWVDPLKEVQARALEVANKFTSRTRVIEDSDVDADFEQILFELAEEEMVMDELGMDSTPVIGKTNPQQQIGDGENPDEATNDPNNADENKSFSGILELVRATPPTPITINVPGQPITINAPVNVPEQKQAIINVPEQKAPIVKVEPKIELKPEIKMPEVKSPEVVVNVAPPRVEITNEVKIPAAKNITVKRGDDGKMSGIEIEKE